MEGPYEWVPASYWLLDKEAGGAHGFATEISPGPAVPPLESLQKFIGPADLWPIGSVWNYHAGKAKSVFDNLTVYTNALASRYGTATGAADYSNKSELQNYENARSFGAIFWMLNNAWPSVHWSLYDYYLKPSGGYFGTKKANEPVHIAYDYLTKKVFVVNSTLTSRSNLTATATLYNIPNLSVASTTQATLNVPANASTPALTIPAVAGLSTTYFIRLQLKDSSGAIVSSNLYWYSTSPDALANKSNWYMTAMKTYANLTGLNALATNPGVTALATRSVAAGTEKTTVTLRNTSTTNVAFFVHPEITAGNGGKEVLPVNYSDNYISLWPGESSTITATYQTSDLGGQSPYLRVRGYNVPATSTALP